MDSTERPAINDVREAVVQRTPNINISVVSRFQPIMLSNDWFDQVCEGIKKAIEPVKP